MCLNTPSPASSGMPPVGASSSAAVSVVPSTSATLFAYSTLLIRAASPTRPVTAVVVGAPAAEVGAPAVDVEPPLPGFPAVGAVPVPPELCGAPGAPEGGATPVLPPLAPLPPLPPPEPAAESPVFPSSPVQPESTALARTMVARNQGFVMVSDPSRHCKSREAQTLGLSA